MDEEEFRKRNDIILKSIEAEYKSTTIFGNDQTRSATWSAINASLEQLCQRYMEDNARRLEKALVTFALPALLAVILFVLDRMSDYVCDWWSKSCRDLSA